MMKPVTFDTLVGKTIERIDNNNDEELIFTLVDGTRYRMFHVQNCCEGVYLEDVEGGDLQSVCGDPVLQAEEATQEADTNAYGTGTWTFYKLATIKASVTLRWLGESNGYYSESVDFMQEER